MMPTTTTTTTTILLHLLSTASLASCAATIVYDGRVAKTVTAADFDSKTGVFDPGNVKATSEFSSSSSPPSWRIWDEDELN